MASWAVAKAKAQFSELIDTARDQGAQAITRNGKLVGVLVSPEEWNQTKRLKRSEPESMSEFFKRSPLVDSGIDLRRRPSRPRKVEL